MESLIASGRQRRTHTHTHTHTSAGEADKDRIYDTPCKQFGYDFLPAVFESFGAIDHRLAGHIQHLENEYLNLHVEEAFGGCTFTHIGVSVSVWRCRMAW